jgi:Flp pilus assembly protein TadD
LPRAIDVYTLYLAQRPDDPNARVDMGICYFELGRQDSAHGAQYVAAAVREMRRVADADPDHQPAAFNLGVVHLFIGATEESSAWFRKAVAIAPDTPLGKRAASLLEQHTFPAQGTP